MNIASSLTDMASRHPQQRAIIRTYGIGNREKFRHSHMSYSELEAKSHALAKGFLATGFKARYRAAVMIEPSFELFATTFALFKAGIVPVFIDPGIGIKNLKKCLAQAQPDYFIGVPKAHIARIILGWNRGRWKKIVSINSRFFCQYSLNKLERYGSSHSQQKLPEINQDDIAAVLFTSGSTGVPKGAVYTHKNFWTQIQLLKEAFAIKPGEIDLCTFPLFALFAPALGMTAVIPEMNFTKPAQVIPQNIFKAIEAFGVTNMFGSPALLKRISEAGTQNRITLPSLKRVISAGAPVPTDTLRNMTLLLNNSCHIFTPYGATEALPVAITNSHEILEETFYQTLQGAGVCVGKPVPNLDVKIIKITDTPIATLSSDLILKPLQIGEIIVSGDQVTKHYLNHPQANELAKINGTNKFYHRMGDVGYLDKKGRLWFCGRKAHRVVTPQEVVYTVPGESILNKHHDVLRTAIVGVGPNKFRRPVLCVETLRRLPHSAQKQLKRDLLDLGKQYSQTHAIKDVLFHRGFPVDIRHNSKIFREKLAAWAERKIL